jgi:hypothetical protein
MTPAADVTRAIYDRDEKLLVLTLQPRGAGVSEFSLDIGPVSPAASWVLFRDGAAAAVSVAGTITGTDAIHVTAHDRTIVVKLNAENATTLVLAFDHV